MTGKSFAFAAALAAGIGLFWACGGSSGRHEDECDNHLDDDGDGLTDCMDPDCDPFAVCVPDGDADSDGDGDTDTDVDTDVDGDADGSNCSTECPAAGDSPLQDLCQMGDCYPSGERRECCVSSTPICETRITVGTMYEDLDVSWRGFYDNDHECMAEVIESLGEMRFRYTIQTRGEACEFGFIRVQVNGSLDVLEVGETYQLCDDPGLAANGTDLVVNVTVGEGGTDQVNYTNRFCEVPGQLTLTAAGSETGQPYDFDLTGRLSQLVDGTPTGEVVDLSLDSTGRVTVSLEE